MKITTGHAEREDRLATEIARLGEALEAARADAAIWRENYEAAMKILAVLAPPDFTEAFEERSFREYLSQ